VRGHLCRAAPALPSGCLDGFGSGDRFRERPPELRRLDGVPRAADQQHVGTVADLLDVDVETVGFDKASTSVVMVIVLSV
jgi:hypothetical protein